VFLSIFVDRLFGGIASIEDILWSDRSGRLFYWLGVPFWNQGVGSRAVARLIEHTQSWTFENRRLSVLYGNCLTENKASIRILKKNGFAEVSEFTGTGDHGGKFEGRRWLCLAKKVNS